MARIKGIKMSMKYIREKYHIPVKRGMLVCWQGHLARITSASNHVRIRFVEPKGVWGARTVYVHPTDDMAYMLPWQQWLYTDVSDKTLAACKEYSEHREKEEKRISRKEDVKKGDTVKLRMNGEIGLINRAEIPEWKIGLEYKVYCENQYNSECVDLLSNSFLEIIRIHKSRLVLVRKAEFQDGEV